MDGTDGRGHGATLAQSWTSREAPRHPAGHNVGAARAASAACRCRLAARMSTTNTLGCANPPAIPGNPRQGRLSQGDASLQHRHRGMRDHLHRPAMSDQGVQKRSRCGDGPLLLPMAGAFRTAVTRAYPVRQGCQRIRSGNHQRERQLRRRTQGRGKESRRFGNHYRWSHGMLPQSGRLFPSHGSCRSGKRRVALADQKVRNTPTRTECRSPDSPSKAGWRACS